ncbi:hypothetical protein C8C83_4519 [Flavobacterium sp. 90]|uniref:hypothetical protein n=1 Tax=unclassified Flavobacterium TaxID=196869 RepID=UPI000EB0F57D|nr:MULTISPECIES: hypothetical protein [unclassified Flavobacterium]RKR05187.1 hypothetical protein C8C82_4861 [Flavobacterium sp. 81]TCK56502.1 hypothetical protein C8C83_4519 [Flavobacterium sp. 90]
MSDQLPVNRVEIDLAHWQSKEARLSKLFSASLSIKNTLLKEKLNNYNKILIKYKGTKSTDELFTLRILENERKRIAKELYPNLLNQLIRTFFNSLVVEPLKTKNYLKDEQKNNEALYDQLRKNGFPDLYNKVEILIRQGHMQFALPVSQYINEKERIDYDLNFSKNEDGYYQFEGYKATLENELKPNENRKHYFKNDELNSFNVEQSYNLLSGRAIQKENIWVQFDLNDKDSNDCYRLKEFHSAYGYSIEKEIKKLPLKELRNRTETVKLMDALKQGSRQCVTFLKNRTENKFYIDANPQFKSINIYDENFKKLTLNSALGVKTLKVVNQQLKNDGQIKNKITSQRNMRLSQ